MARVIAQRFNHIYGEIFVLPEAVVDEKAAVLSGLDGRKMSKSYNNTIPLFVPSKKLRKLIMKIKTNSLEPGKPKDPDDECTVFDIYKAFAMPDETAAFRQKLIDGLGWGDAKQDLFEYLDTHVESVLQAGAARARESSAALIAKVREAVGIGSLA
jgi:tryptophanyl-tRNA synthetase